MLIEEIKAHCQDADSRLARLYDFLKIDDYKKKMADIVPFLISKENGEVVPAGWPIYDKNYIQARVISSDPELEREYSQLMTFYAARNRAYGTHDSFARRDLYLPRQAGSYTVYFLLYRKPAVHSDPTL